MTSRYGRGLGGMVVWSTVVVLRYGRISGYGSHGRKR